MNLRLLLDPSWVKMEIKGGHGLFLKYGEDVYCMIEERKQVEERVQAEHSSQAKLDYERREEEGEQERGHQLRGSQGQEAKRPVWPKWLSYVGIRNGGRKVKPSPLERGF